MTTATQSRELPRLRTDHVPLALDNADGFDIAAHYRELRDEARRARNAVDEAERAQHQAATEDTAAASDAAYAGKKLPARTREAEAAEDDGGKAPRGRGPNRGREQGASRDRRHRSRRTRGAVAGTGGRVHRGSPSPTCRTPRPSGRGRGRTVALAGFEQWLAKARKSDNGRLPAGRGQNAKSIHVNSGANDPARLVELLREWDPRWDR